MTYERTGISVLKNTIFIAQTGWGQEEYIKRSIEAGFDHHLVRPVKINALISILESINHRCVA